MSRISRLTADDVDLMTSVMEEIIESNLPVNRIMARYGITYDEYRIISDLSMPKIRDRNKSFKGVHWIKSKAYEDEE